MRLGRNGGWKKPWSLEAVNNYLINTIASELRKDNSSTGIDIVVYDKHYSVQTLKIEEENINFKKYNKFLRLLIRTLIES